MTQEAITKQKTQEVHMGDIRQNWQQIIKPYRVFVEQEKDDQRSASIVFDPLERGFGLTLGTALRRVILSSLRGSAITSVRFHNALHEFSALPGVKEDVTRIVLNLKKLDLKLEGKEKALVHLKVAGPRIVTAADIEKTASVTFATPSQEICTLAEGASLDCEMVIEQGKGYVPAQEHSQESAPLGTIFLDALFNPVRHASFTVDRTRVGQMTDYDALTLRIETNGSITPRDAISSAACILQEQFSKFVAFPDDIALEPEKKDTTKEDDTSLSPDLLRRIEEVDLPPRAYNCLQKEGVLYVGDLVQRTEASLLAKPNFGTKSLTEVSEFLGQMGLCLGMKLTGWPPENLKKESENEYAEKTDYPLHKKDDLSGILRK